MAQTDEQKAKEAEQTDLFGKLEKNDVAVPKDKAEAMKENILKANSGQAWLGLGVHEVEVTSVELVEAKTGTMGIKFIVENGEGKGEVSMWLSEAALPYTIENVSRLVVHNAPEGNKDEARKFMANIQSAKELFNTIQAFVEEAKAPFVCFLSVREDRNGATYKDKNGEDKPSLERNLLSYRPKETTTQAVASTMGGGEVVAGKTNINNLPF